MAVTKTIIKRRNRVRRPKAAVVTTTVTQNSRRRNRRNRPARSLRVAGNAGESGQNYLRCLLGEGSAKIPDGDSHHSVLIDFKTTQLLTPTTTGDLVVACLPGLPGSLRILRGAGTIRNIRGGITTVTVVPGGGLSVPYTDFTASGPTNFSLTNDQSVVLKARVVSYKMSVAQIGPVLQQQGVVATARLPILYGDVKIPVGVDYSNANDLIAGFTFANLKGNQIAMASSAQGMDYSSVSVYPTASDCNATKECCLYGRGCGNWVPTFYGQTYWADQLNTHFGDGLLMLTSLPLSGGASGAWGGVASGANNISPVFPYIPASTDNVLPGDYWLDPECEALIWAGGSLGSSGTQFRVTVSVCMELDVIPVSSIYRPLITPPVKEDLRAIAASEEIMRVMPASVSKSEGSMGWIDTITTAVTGVADIVSSMGIPIVSPAAAIGARMARALGFS